MKKQTVASQPQQPAADPVRTGREQSSGIFKGEDGQSAKAVAMLALTAIFASSLIASGQGRDIDDTFKLAESYAARLIGRYDG